MKFLINLAFFLIVLTASGQSHFGEDGLDVHVGDLGLPLGGSYGNGSLPGEPDFTFNINVMWLSDGSALNNSNPGLLSFDAMLGVVAAKFEVRLVQVTGGQVVVVVDWSETDLIGNTQGGTKVIGVLKQSSLGVLSDINSQTNSSPNNISRSNSWDVVVGNGNGNVVPITYYKTTGHWDGTTYHVISSAVTVFVHLPGSGQGHNGDR